MIRLANLALPVGLLVTALAAPAFSDDAPKVVVTIKPIHALVSQVMAGTGTPRLIVDGAASPHTFSLKPSAARAIQDADVFVRVSEDLEPFTRKLVDGLPATVMLLTLADPRLGVKLLDRRTAGTFEAHADREGGVHNHDAHDDHDAEDAAGKDAHLWLDPENGKAILAAVAKVLSVKWPAHATMFKANAETAAAHLDGLSKSIAADLASVKGKPFVVFHDAYQYFERRFGLSAVGSVTVSPDRLPSAKRLTEVRRKIASLGAACVFAEPGFQPNLLAAVTEGTHARTGELDPEGITLDPGPGLYDALLLNLARNIRDCLSASP